MASDSDDAEEFLFPQLSGSKPGLQHVRSAWDPASEMSVTDFKKPHIILFLNH